MLWKRVLKADVLRVIAQSGMICLVAGPSIYTPCPDGSTFPLPARLLRSFTAF